MLLGLNAQAAKQRDLCLLLDAYTTQGDCLSLEKQEVRRALAHKQVHTAESGKLTLLLDGQTPVPGKETMCTVLCLLLPNYP